MITLDGGDTAPGVKNLLGQDCIPSMTSSVCADQSALESMLPGLLWPFAVPVLQTSAVGPGRCYSVVTKSEFAVPSSEQLRTGGLGVNLKRMLSSTVLHRAVPEEIEEEKYVVRDHTA